MEVKLKTPDADGMTGAEITASIEIEGSDEDSYPVAGGWDYADEAYHRPAETQAIDAWLETEAGLDAVSAAFDRAEETKNDE